MSKVSQRSSDRKADVRPLLLGPKNCEAATGLPWRWCRDTAQRLGVRLVTAGRKQAIPADQFLAALEAANETSEPVAEVDAAEQVRRLVGLR